MKLKNNIRILFLFFIIFTDSCGDFGEVFGSFFKKAVEETPKKNGTINKVWKAIPGSDTTKAAIGIGLVGGGVLARKLYLSKKNKKTLEEINKSSSSSFDSVSTIPLENSFKTEVTPKVEKKTFAELALKVKREQVKRNFKPKSPRNGSKYKSASTRRSLSNSRN